MKTNKPKVHKKDAKKAGKKELAKTLTERFLQLMKEMGQEAEKIGLDINKVGVSAIKKLSAKLTGEKSPKKTVVHPEKQFKKAVDNNGKPRKKAIADEVKFTKKAVVDEVKVAKKTPEVTKDTKTVSPVRKAVSKGRPAAQSVKVVPILSEENAAKALAKKTPVKKTTRAPRKTKTKTDEDVTS
ncbi:hypothetical protein [Pedobacter immunditicola]|uniref:hypothetical protein n=1 Tax=Pedobacter immunditicola TaxID=3133440 RepID=UPI0030982CA2